MSCRYETVVVPWPSGTAGEKLAARLARAAAPMPLDLGDVRQGVAFLLPDVQRGHPFGVCEPLARLASVGSGCAVWLKWSDMVGVREASCFVDGVEAASYGEQDEWWVPIDEEGMPMTSGPRYRFDELPEGLEVETVEDAVELAFRRLGFPVPSRDVRQAIVTACPGRGLRRIRT